jgi:hypothetical protein
VATPKDVLAQALGAVVDIEVEAVLGVLVGSRKSIPMLL